jgi:hypothetical protein
MFDLWVTDGVVARWDSTDVAYMTFRIVDADSTNDDDIVPLIWNYFTDADEDPSYGGLQYTFPDDSTYTKIIIRLYDNEDFSGACSEPAYFRECTNYSRAYRPENSKLGPYRAFTLMAITPDSSRACDGPYTEFTVEDLVTDGFAHELHAFASSALCRASPISGSFLSQRSTTNNNVRVPHTSSMGTQDHPHSPLNRPPPCPEQ